MIEVTSTATGFSVAMRGAVVLSHTADAPLLAVGTGEAQMPMQRGNFTITDHLDARWELPHLTLDRDGDAWLLACRSEPQGPARLTLRLSGDDEALMLEFVEAAPGLNRIWLRLPAETDEHVWGCGEQFSYFDLRGRRFPLWTSEPGVGRDKTTEITRRADIEKKGGGGDYYNTNFPQPTFISSRRYAAHVDTTAYAVFDFSDPSHHALEVWEIPLRLELYARPRFTDLVQCLAARFGHPPAPPAWIFDGAIIGLKQGEASFARLDRIIAAGAHVSAIWCEDWVGLRETSFGSRLFWDWHWNAARYPELPQRIAALRERGIRFLAYTNPYLCIDGTQFPQAKALGHLVRNAAGRPYIVDFGEFECGLIDLTNPAACDWFKTHVLRTNMMDIGIAGWMADFAEYLPVDTRLASGANARLVHNAWPTLWAELNAAAIAEAGAEREVTFFIRAGYTGTQRHCALLWAGDQSVDFSRHDGLGTVICAALSSGLLGSTFHHSDIGGYTSLFGNIRTAELMQRWAEMAAFTPVMRTHEGNRPGDNLQIDSDPQVLAHFVRMTRLYRHLVPYLKQLVAEAVATGLPVQRPLFLHFQDDPATYTIQDSYLYGAELLVAPVHAAGAGEWSVYLPSGEDWLHIWSGATHRGGGSVTVAAPLGQPPVFCRAGSPWRPLFEGLRDL